MSTISGNAKKIFLNAVERIDPSDWPVFLEGACGGDAELRHHVEELLNAHQHEDSLFDVPPTEDARKVDQPIGETVGNYKLLQKIGEGGFGVVYMAEQTQPVQRKVALKIIKPGMDSKEVIARFEAERQALAMMDHPNMAKVLDAGATNSGHPYFVMELVRGVPITEFCDAAKLPIRERLDLFIRVCEAVQHAHQKGIIHRDIKSSNVLVAKYDDKPVPKIIDFGVAKAIGKRLTEKTMFTQFGQIVGTLEYMSPEQAQFNQLDVDTRSDIYSLGVLLYELLTGETPFDRQRLRSSAFDELLRILREEVPPRPSNRVSTLGERAGIVSSKRASDPAKLSGLLRGDLDWIVMKAMEKERGRRYVSASSLGDDILRFVNNEPVQARPPSAVYQARKFLKRNKFGVVAATLVVLAVGLGFGFTVQSKLEADRQRSMAQSALSKYGEEAFQRAFIAAMSNDPAYGELINTARNENLNIDQFQLSLLEGLHHLYEGNPDEAATFFESVIQSKPDSVAAKAALSVANLHRGKFIEWLNATSTISELMPESPEDFLLKGQAISVAGDPDEALRLADEAINKRHSLIAIASRAEIRAWNALEENKFSAIEPAILDVQALRRTMPNPSAFALNADLVVHLVALMLAEQDQYEALADEAQDPANELLEHFPQYEFGRYHRASLFAITGQHAKAEQEWSEILHLKRRPAWVGDFAHILYRNGKYEEAKRQLQMLSFGAETIYGTYILCENEGDLSKLRSQVTKTKIPFLPEIQLRSLVLLGAHDQASRLAGEYLDTLPDLEGTWSSWERAKLRYYAQPDFTENDLLNAAGDQRFRKCDAFCVLGVEALAQGNSQAAESYFEQATETRAVWFESYQMADAMLARLLSTPGWPDWISENHYN